MDALAQLALMTKAKLVFESPGSFLSFPALSPISYSADELKFGAFTAVETAERLIFSEFSRFANALPSGTIFQPQGDSYLWDAYSQVLKSARLAKGQTTPEQEAAYQQAVSFLTRDRCEWLADRQPRLAHLQAISRCLVRGGPGLQDPAIHRGHRQPMPRPRPNGAMWTNRGCARRCSTPKRIGPARATARRWSRPSRSSRPMPPPRRS